jgi:S-adenosylmethionine-dependent methyltransferase
MKADTESRFESAQEYAAYLQTPEGRLRLDLAWSNLQPFLPSPSAGNNLKALDIGGGTGAMALKLAGVGFDVTVLDKSQAMLAMAESAAAQAGLSHRISMILGDVANLHTGEYAKLEPASFAVIVCHNLLEFVDDVQAILGEIKRLINPASGIVSILVRNRAGEVLKAGIKSGDLDQSAKNLIAETVVESLYGGEARLFNSRDLRDSLSHERLDTIAERGVRVMSDYLPAPLFQDDAGYARVLAFEQRLAEKTEFAAIARYTQLLARPAGN